MASGTRLGPNPILAPRMAVFVACFAFCLYLPTLGFKFVWDDPMLLELVHSRLQAGGIGHVLSSEFLLGSGTSHTGFFRPLVLLSLAADGWLAGGSPAVFHLTNLLLHALASALVVLLLGRVLADGPSALAGGLLFAAHPVHVEAVAFISGRTDLWAALFILLGTVVWLRGRGANPEGAGWATSIGTSVCLLLGAFSKELAVMAVPAWLCWDYFAGFEPSGSRDGWARRNGAWLISATVALAVVAAIRWGALGIVLSGAPPPTLIPGVPEPSAMALLLPRLATYFKLLVVPWPLSAFYAPSDLVPGPGIYLGALLALAFFLVAGLKGPRHTGAVAFCWTLLFLVPVLGVATLSTAAAERFLYVPSFGACLAVAVVWGQLHRRNRNLALAVGGAVLVFCVVGTLLREQVWRDELSLYSNMAETSPRAFVAQFNLGNELAKAGRIEEAQASLARAVEVAPARADAWNNLGSVRARLGNDAEAEKAFAEAVRLKPDFVVAIRNRAWALARLHRYDDAARAFADLLARQPDDVDARKGLFDVLAEQGKWEEGLKALEGWPQAAADDRELLTRRAVALVQLDRPGEALASLTRVENPSPDDVPLLLATGRAMADVGQWNGAETAFQRAIRAAPDQAKAYSYLGFVYLRQNRAGDAIPLLERAVALDPGDALARSNLATARRLGRTP